VTGERFTLQTKSVFRALCGFRRCIRYYTINIQCIQKTTHSFYWSCRYVRYLIRENYILYVQYHVLYIRSYAFIYGDLIETCFFFVASWGRNPSNYFEPISIIIYHSLCILCISASLYVLTKFQHFIVIIGYMFHPFLPTIPYFFLFKDDICNTLFARSRGILSDFVVF
jgi:hypothetical protein